MARKFLIVTKDVYDGLTLDYSQMLSNSPSWNLAGTECFFKYENKKPDCLDSLVGVKTLSQMQELIRDYSTGWDEDSE